MLSLTSLPLGFASTPATECASDRAAQPPVPAVMPGFGTKAHILLGAVRSDRLQPSHARVPPLTALRRSSYECAARVSQAPDYPPYTGWSDTVPTDPTTTGFNVEVGLLAEPICGIKVGRPNPPASTRMTPTPFLSRAPLIQRFRRPRSAAHPFCTPPSPQACPSSPPPDRLHLCTLVRVLDGQARVHVLCGSHGVRRREPVQGLRPRLHRVHARQGRAQLVARVHALDPRWPQDRRHPYAPRRERRSDHPDEHG